MSQNDSSFEIGPPVVIWNPTASSKARADAVLTALRTWPEIIIERPASREETRRLLFEREPREETIVAAGGDGTISCVAEALQEMQSPAVLGILPLGSGNDLARSLEIPFDPQQAINVLRTGDVRYIDVAEIHGHRSRRFYLNMLTGGNTGRFLEVMTAELKQRWGPFCYLRGVIDVLQNMECFPLRITLDHGQTEEFDALNVFLANGKMSGGGMSVSPQAEIDDGLLDVVIVQEGDPGDIAGLTAEYFLADYLQHPLVEFRQGSHIHIESASPLPLTADGDQIGDAPVTLSVRRRALAVRVPQPAPHETLGTPDETDNV